MPVFRHASRSLAIAIWSSAGWVGLDDGRTAPGEQAGLASPDLGLRLGTPVRLPAMKLIYKPFAIIAGLIASRLGRSAFKTLWTRIDNESPPKPGSGEGSLVKLVGAQTLQAGVMAGTRATVDRLFAQAFHHLFGAWPEKQPEPDDDE
jgi:hypothetical protein